MLENTEEYNRHFRLLNGAGLDPYHDQPIPNQQPLDIPRPDDDHQWDVLDGQEYKPAPEVIPDTRTGYDQNGDYHAIPTNKTALEGLKQAITPFRWRDYLQDAITQLVSTYDYDVGTNERYELAEQIVAERMEALDSNLEKLQLDKALELWKESYGRGYRLRG